MMIFAGGPIAAKIAFRLNFFLTLNVWKGYGGFLTSF
ncbi:hypothetical protein BZL35_00728 [Candidatus Pandoraea novymonadis]|uniref:Uncharacterized protein n=1 Tax=Candidatus Pandoraea novymonadis TaxID=1808959 RepID=A0ABX5FHW4_9BURK|nr:hypothetical protein BZL35_00728 [Candidatus Pandoraea novymonadis]